MLKDKDTQSKSKSSTCLATQFKQEQLIKLHKLRATPIVWQNSLGKNRILPTLQKFCQVKKSVISDRLEKFTWQTKENLY